MKDKIVSIIEQRVDSADVKGTPEGMAEEILAELFQQDFIDALEMVLELANENVIDDDDDPDMVEHADIQNDAIETVHNYLSQFKARK